MEIGLGWKLIGFLVASTRMLGGLCRGDNCVGAVERDGSGADSEGRGATCSGAGLSGDVSDVVAVVAVAAVTGAGGGVVDCPVDVVGESRLTCGTVEKSPGLLSMIAAAPAATRTAEARPITIPRFRGLRQNGGGGGGFFFMTAVRCTPWRSAPQPRADLPDRPGHRLGGRPVSARWNKSALLRDY